MNTREMFVLLFGLFLPIHSYLAPFNVFEMSIFCLLYFGWSMPRRETITCKVTQVILHNCIDLGECLNFNKYKYAYFLHLLQMFVKVHTKKMNEFGTRTKQQKSMIMKKIRGITSESEHCIFYGTHHR